MTPRKLSLEAFLFRFFASIGGSIAGTLLLSATFFLSLSAFSEQSSETLSLYIILVIILVGTLSTNVFTPFLIALTDKERYSRPLTILTQAFILNITIFLVSVPLYSLLQIARPEMLSFVAGFHLLLTTQVSAILLELYSDQRFILGGIYGVALGSLLSFCFIITLYGTNKETLIMFILGPLLWISIECCRSLVEIGYYFYYRLFGIEALDTETSYEVQEKKDQND